MLFYENIWLNGQLGEERQTPALRCPEQSSCYYFTSSPISPMFCTAQYPGRKSISCPKEVLTQRLAGKRYLLKTTEAAPLPPPWLHNGWPRNGLPPSSEKEAFLPMALFSDPCYSLGIEALGLAQMMPGGVGRFGKSGRSSMHLHNVLCPCQCPTSIAAFTLWGRSWVVVTVCGSQRLRHLLFGPLKEKFSSPWLRAWILETECSGS